MRQYFKNVIRTILQNKISYLGAVFIIALGSLVYIAMSDFLKNLDREGMKYLDDSRLSDVMASVEGMPSSDLSRLESIEGVENTFGRLEGNVRLIPEGSDKIITLHVLAYSPDDTMNLITLDPVYDEVNSDEIFLGKNIADIYGIQKGDTVNVLANGKNYELKVSGIGYASEYLNPMPDDALYSPDYSIYDIAIMSREGLEKLLNRENIVTNIGIELSRGYSYSDVYYGLESMLSQYGYNGSTPRKESDAYLCISDEVEAYEMIIAVIPTIFMAVTVFMLYIILKKMVDKDRQLIGTLKAFGTTDMEIMKVYMLQGVLIGILGAILPILPAEYFAQYLFLDDMNYYNVPSRLFTIYPDTIFKIFVIDILTALIAVFLGVYDVLKINPAESMRSNPPQGGNVKLPLWLEARLNTRQKLAATAILRNKLRSAVIAVAIALPFAMTCVLPAYNFASKKSAENQFGKVEKYNYKIKLGSNITPDGAEQIIRKIEGISKGELMASYQVKLTGTYKYEYVSLMAIDKESELYRIMDHYYNFFEPRDDGIIISHHLADRLHIKAGDTVELDSAYLCRTGEPVKVYVTEVIEDDSGMGAYISMEGLQNLFSVSPSGDALLIKCERGMDDTVLSEFSKLKNISYIVDANNALDGYNEMMGTTVLMLDFIAVFSVIAGIIMIYSIISIGVRERKNEFGTLMVLGMKRSEISEIIISEQTVNFISGIILGIPFVIMLKKIVQFAVDTDTETILIPITAPLCIFSFAICFVATAVSIILILKDLFNIELTDVLKERE